MKRFKLIILLATITAGSYAQIQVGIKSGVNWLKFWQSDSEYHPTLFGPKPGSMPVAIYLCQRSNHLVNVSFEAEYLNRNYTMNEIWGGLGSPGENHLNMDVSYLIFTFEPQLVFGKKIKLLVYPGICLGIPLTSKMTGSKYEKSGETETNEAWSGSAKGYISDFELGAVAGAGIDVQVFKALHVTANYTFSISILATDSKWADNSYRFLQHKAELGVAYQFNTGHKEAKKER